VRGAAEWTISSPGLARRATPPTAALNPVSDETFLMETISTISLGSRGEKTNTFFSRDP
jgi:hypothetical protein